MHAYFVMDRHNTGHDVDNPLRINNNSTPKKIVVKMLNHPQFVQKTHRLFHLVAVNPRILRRNLSKRGIFPFLKSGNLGVIFVHLLLDDFPVEQIECGAFRNDVFACLEPTFRNHFADVRLLHGALQDGSVKVTDALTRHRTHSEKSLKNKVGGV